MLDVGDAAPAISAQNQDDETVTPAFEDPTVVYFYPRDGTPGCTLEAQQFRDHHDAFRDVSAAVYGVSTDTVDDHAEFAAEEDLPFDLLADPDGEVAGAFGLDVSEGFVERVTFVLAGGEVVAVVDADDVNPDGHAADVLAAVEDAS
ncbi:peroxiredoxin [Halorientalis marina]|uniref:peroxiredoxin n=1 Tax=Halorientalis marina TaxID=2931976 RepID=UPI001FF3BCE1|nr:peroxiredoxin [Halorientalis marina]